MKMKVIQFPMTDPLMHLFVLVSLLAAAEGLLPTSVRAETRVAAALTPEAVWDAFNAAQDGDTVQLPAGTAVWTNGWNSRHRAKMKAITMQGAGMDKTIIRADTTTSGDKAFVIYGVEGKPFRITGITFDGTGFLFPWIWGGEVSIGGNCKNFRVDHCKFLSMDRMMTIKGDTYGLIDHCDFYALQKHIRAQTIWQEGPGKSNYRKPLSLGTAEAVYFEDNDVHFSPEVVNPDGNNPWIAPNDGSRIVIRHNTIINSQLEIYRPGRDTGMYGCQTCEIYDNTFSAVGLNMGRPQGFIFIAGGVAMVFSNTVTGTTYNIPRLELRNERAWRDLPGFPKADGKNPMDGNEIPAGQLGAGYPCLGQVGRGTDVKGTGILELSPCYAWGNTFNGAPLRMEVSSRADANEAATIKEGRDFYNEEPKPEHYKPYVYPHPLQSESAWEALMKSAAASANGTKPSAGNP